MVNWDISKTQLWKQKETETGKESWELIMKETGVFSINILMGVGAWLVANNRRQERKEGKKWDGHPYVFKESDVEYLFDSKDKENNIDSIIQGGVPDPEDRVFLKNALMKMVGAEFC